MRPSLSVLFLNYVFSAQAQSNRDGTAGDISLTITPAQLTHNFPGGTKSIIPGAPPLPTAAISPGQYPTLDRIPPTDSSVVKEWLSKINMTKVPAINPNGLNGCSNTTVNGDAIAKSGSSDNCWWTCSGCTRPTDITTCPTKGTWGATFDDGPSEYTPNVLQYLEQHQLNATFFVVGSRAVSYPEILRAEYMLGHEVCLHTWSHPALTTITNEQIVAEVAWSMKAFKDILGVVPQCFRPPYADVDDRVRYILKSMGLKIILWTGNGNSNFDTDDWRVVDGSSTVSGSIQKFNQILGTASSLQTGFIVLAHDLFPQTVALSLKSFLPTALSTPNLKVQSVNTCLGQPLTSSYFETAGNAKNSTTLSGNSAGQPTNSTNGQHAPTGTVTSASSPSGLPNTLKDTATSGASHVLRPAGLSVFLITVMLIFV